VLTLPGQFAAAYFTRRRPGLLGWAAGLLALLVAVPVLAVLANLLAPGQETWRHLADTVLAGYVWNTVALMLGVGGLVLLVGVGTARLVTMFRFPGSRLLEWALILPLAVPAYVMAYAYVDFLQVSGPLQTGLRAWLGWRVGGYWFPEVRSLAGAMLMLAMVLYPYVYLLARAAFREQSICVVEVSRTLGCGPWERFWRVEVPLARPAIAAGLALALMETAGDYGVVSYFGIQTFTTGIYRAWFSMGEPVAAAQLSSTLLAFIFLLLLLERWSRSGARYHHTSARYRALAGQPLAGGRAALAMLACLVPLTLGFLLPVAILVWMALVEGDPQLGPRYLRLAWNSVTLAGISAVFAVLAALMLAYALRLRPGLVTRVANRVAALGYAVPGTVIAVGTLIPFAWLDNALDARMRSWLGVSTGLLLTGSVAALVFAYLVRFLSIALQTAEASLAKITPHMDHVARSLGSSAGATLWRVHAPLMKGSILTAGLLVFVDVMKELPATLIMRPFNFDTLAVQAYNLAKDERLGEASTAALTIVLVGLLPVVLLSRAIRRARPGHASD
jgi:iron(III) transport system permease protein